MRSRAGYSKGGVEPRRFYRSYPEMVVISHDASLTGAPILLLTWLRWLADHGGARFRIILRAGGRLEERFASTGRVLNLGLGPRRERLDASVQRRLLSYCGPDVRVIYANTAAVGDVVESLDPLGCPVLAHIHELETMLAHNIGHERFRMLAERAARYVVPAAAVAENLIQRHGVRDDLISVVPEYLADDYGAGSDSLAPGLGQTRTVLGAGTTDWRKGPDLFVRLAAACRRRAPADDLRFVWVGAPTEGGQLEQLRTAAREDGVGEVVVFVGEQSDLRSFYHSAAVFVSTSREDPYPVVCLEAAAHGLPIICFGDAGGIRDFVRDDAGRVVPHLDVDAMADALIAMLANEPIRRALGETARRRVNAENRVSSCGPKLLAEARALARGRDPR